ncbi:TPA: MGMT family protein [Candidatus Bathyarchaeota archaeon]|nr:MGMT family protein [Candidatus Bathyarchaeota archaeon]
MKELSKDEVIRYLADLTSFERSVLLATLDIPKGKVSTYKRIAERIGRPNAYRAVGNALKKNPAPSLIPCHRVVRSDGRLGGEQKRAERRRKILRQEGIVFVGDKVKLTKKVLF